MDSAQPENTRAPPPRFIDLPAAQPLHSSTSPRLSIPTSSLRTSHSAWQPLQDDNEARVQQAPSSPVKIHTPTSEYPTASSAIIQNGGIKLRKSETPDDTPVRKATEDPANKERPSSPPFIGTHVRNISSPMIEPSDPLDALNLSFNARSERPGTPRIHVEGEEAPALEESPGLQYHHLNMKKQHKRRVASKTSIGTANSTGSDSQTASSGGDHIQDSPRSIQSKDKQPQRRSFMPRPASNYSLGAEIPIRGRSLTPQDMARDHSRPVSMYGRNLSSASDGRIPIDRPMSTIDLLNIPYSKQMAHEMLALEHANVKGAVGSSAALLDVKKTLDMYRANLRKTNNTKIQWDFALFMVTAVRDASQTQEDGSGDSLANPTYRKELIKEARAIMQRLADRSHPFAQYYLGDGYASGFFNNGKPDNDKAFGYFVSAGKHGHAEAAYRAALCYEMGWGSRSDVSKAIQYYRTAATMKHPGAAVRLGMACIRGYMGLQGKSREGVKWLKVAATFADGQHNSGPYELGLLHIDGYGADVFKDESYAAQLLTKSAELGHANASLKMGRAYEHRQLGCPQDFALSIHYYNKAAEAGSTEGMMALCAWYIVGVDSVLPKDEAEAYAQAKRAADLGDARAEYAIGYFTEMGIGCRRDPLEANSWYSRAAEQNDELAISRLENQKVAEFGQREALDHKPDKKMLRKKKSNGGELAQKDKDCVLM